jgi:hypothetical protein
VRGGTGRPKGPHPTSTPLPPLRDAAQDKPTPEKGGRGRYIGGNRHQAKKSPSHMVGARAGGVAGMARRGESKRNALKGDGGAGYVTDPSLRLRGT